MGDLHDCLMVNAELRAELLEDAGYPWVEDFLEDREEFVDLIILGHMLSDDSDFPVAELEHWLTQVRP